MLIRVILNEEIYSTPTLLDFNRIYRCLCFRAIIIIPLTSSFCFIQNENNFALSQTHRNQSLRSRSVTLAQMISQTVWRLSDSIIIQWEPKYFNETVNRMLELINSNKLQDAKGTFYFMLFLKGI